MCMLERRLVFVFFSFSVFCFLSRLLELDAIRRSHELD